MEKMVVDNTEFHIGEYVNLENADGMRMTGRVVDKYTTVEYQLKYIVELDTGAYKTYTQEELNQECVVSW